ncbi:hypothetical protein FraQA3DRAFT_4674 [Frankia sp. QA3]|nr:hypothetical protein FraQA3DRAFT_4674 [Frankia sp. QA3]
MAGSRSTRRTTSRRESCWGIRGWLGALKAVVGGRQAFIPDTVITELRRSASADSSIQAERLCERVLVIDHGRLAYDGDLAGLAGAAGADRAPDGDLGPVPGSPAVEPSEPEAELV